MKLAIIGAGAMGGVLASYLSEQAEVWLLDGWQTQVDTINREGLICEREDGEALSHPHAASDPAQIGPCDAVLVMVKAHQTAWAGEQAKSLLASSGSSVVVTLQNGVGNRDILAGILGDTVVGHGVTAHGATLVGPGRVRHAGQGMTTLGTAPDPAAMQRLAELFVASGLPAEVSENLDGLVWGKLVVNVGINALTALLRVPNGALVAVPELQALLEQAVGEALVVAAARGTQLPFEDPLAHVLSVARITGANRSSMLQDALRGSPTEIATINGAIVREGQRLGVPTPFNSMLVSLLQALDATASVRVS